MTEAEYREAFVSAMNRIGAALEELAKKGLAGGGSSAGKKSDGGGSVKRREKPPIDECLSVTGTPLPPKVKQTKTEKDYLALTLATDRGDFSINVFQQDADIKEVHKLIAHAIDAERDVTIFYAKKPGSNYSDFVEVKLAGAAPKDEEDDSAPF
jgi:hypothetical protein